MKKILTTITLGAWSLLAGCATASEPPPDPPQPASLLERITEAFETNDSNGLASLVTEDFEQITVTPEGTTVEIRGREAYREALEARFAAHDSVTTTFEATLEAGPYLAVRRSVRRSNGDRMEGEISLVIYEVRDGEIVRAWHYPPYRMMMAMP